MTAEHPGSNHWGAVVVAALATFIVVTAEIMPIGLLTPIATSLMENEGTIGLSLTITGLVAAFTAPLVPIATSKFDRRSTLIVLMMLVAAANALTAAAPSFAVMAIARVLLGVSMGGVWALAASLAPRLVKPRSVGLAATVVFGGVAVASVLGVPTGTFLGAAAGWTVTFWSLAAAACILALAMFVALPKMPTAGTLRVSTITAQFRNPGVRIGLTITLLLVAAHFAGYTYVRAALESFAGLPATLVATAFLIYGVLGVLGNFVAGPVAAIAPKQVVAVLSLGITATLALFPLLAGNALAAVLLMAAWGLFYGGVSVSTQTWIFHAAHAQGEAAAALWVSVFNASIALGAFAGGSIFDSGGPEWLFWIAAAGGMVAVIFTMYGRPGSAR